MLKYFIILHFYMVQSKSFVSELIKLKPLLDEAVRQYLICDSCRLCNADLCPVFGTIEAGPRAEPPLISTKDVIFYANVCYDHRDCYYACPYVPPHEFNVDIPKLNREIRLNIYSELTFNLLKSIWGRIVLVLLFIPVIVMWVLEAPHVFITYPISFYNVMPKIDIVISGLVVLVYLIVLAIYMILRYNSMIGPVYRPKLSTLFGTIKDILVHNWFPDMHYPSWYWSDTRFIYHILIFYGFTLDLIATIIGAIYEDVLHIPSPFPITNPAVITGAIGGVMIIIGAIIALYARYVSIKEQKFVQVGTIDMIFVITLLLTALTGLLVLSFRLINMIMAMNIMLLVHLTFIYALFVIMPLTSTMPHIVLRAYSLWIYNSIVNPKRIGKPLKIPPLIMKQ